MDSSKSIWSQSSIIVLLLAYNRVSAGEYRSCFEYGAFKKRMRTSGVIFSFISSKAMLNVSSDDAFEVGEAGLIVCT